jgi:hypothetical protein
MLLCQTSWSLTLRGKVAGITAEHLLLFFLRILFCHCVRGTFGHRLVVPLGKGENADDYKADNIFAIIISAVISNVFEMCFIGRLHLLFVRMV